MTVTIGSPNVSAVIIIGDHVVDQLRPKIILNSAI